MSMGSPKQTLCRLCLNIIIDTDFEVIEEIIEGILQLVLPCLVLEAKAKNIICRTCHINLIAAYNFKSMCVDNEDVIFSYINSEQMPVVELKDVYLKEKGNIQLISILDNQRICRLCMQLIANGFVSLNEVDLGIIINYIPEVNIDTTKDPVICRLCVDSLHKHGNFVKKCLDAQKQYMESYIKMEEIDIKAEHSDQDSDFSSHELFEETLKNNKSKHISKDAREIKFEADVGAPLNKNKYKMDFNNDLKHEKSKELNENKCDECDPSKAPMHKCDEHDFQTKHKGDLMSHELKHQDVSKVQTYKCGTCNYETKYECCLKVHLITHKHSPEVQMYKCDMCSYESKKKRNLRHHQLIHKDPSEIQMYKCCLCSYETKYKEGLKRHHQLLHKDPSEVKIYKCDVCSFETKYKDRLNRHLLIHNSPEVQTYNCDVCSYRTMNKRYIKQHQLMHKDSSEIEMYKCDTCTYVSQQKSNVKAHQLTHKDPSEVKMYTCDMCSYGTKYKSGLKRHLKLKHKYLL